MTIGLVIRPTIFIIFVCLFVCFCFYYFSFWLPIPDGKFLLGQHSTLADLRYDIEKFNEK